MAIQWVGELSILTTSNGKPTRGNMSPNVKYPAKLSCQFPVKVARDMTWNRKSMAAKRASQGIPEGICGAEAVYLLTAKAHMHVELMRVVTHSMH